jgi:hypothetical protein
MPDFAPLRAAARVCRPFGRALTLSAVALAGVACTPEPASAPTARPKAPSTLAGAAEARPPSPPEVRPVYPTGPVTPDATAAALCRALHETPARRRAECCQRPAPPAGAHGAACTRLLSLAVADGAIRLDAGATAACIATLEAAGGPSTCETQGRFAPGPAPDGPCVDVVVGLRRAGAECRSDLECEGSMQCRGAGPTTPGTCAGPNQVGMGCGEAVDVLVAQTGLPGSEARHPECDGLCVQRRCTFLTPAGAACRANAACGPGRACVEGLCADAPTGLGAGEPCPGLGCAASLRCVEGRCRAPAPTGAICTHDGECAGACLKPAANARQGKCGPFCPP